MKLLLVLCQLVLTCTNKIVEAFPKQKTEQKSCLLGTSLHGRPRKHSRFGFYSPVIQQHVEQVWRRLDVNVAAT